MLLLSITIGTPYSIDTSDHFWDCFGNYEKEVTAWWIIVLMKFKGGWYTFTRREMERVYNSNRKMGIFHFNGLVKEGWIEIVSDHKESDSDCVFKITNKFVARIWEKRGYK